MATIRDVPRIGLVATAGFYHSPVFPWERPHHAKHPRSTMMSYRSMFAEQIRDPAYVVVVIEGSGQSDEDKHTEASIIRDEGNEIPRAGRTVIVGAASWKFPLRYGQFMDVDDEGSEQKPEFPQEDGADKDTRACELLDAACEEREARLFTDHTTMDMVVVHPAYWRRGFGSHMVRWGNELADMDQTKIGVSSSASGEPLYQVLKFQKLDSVVVENDNSSSSVYQGFWQRLPKHSAL